jgi:hypothetical protein
MRGRGGEVEGGRGKAYIVGSDHAGEDRVLGGRRQGGHGGSGCRVRIGSLLLGTDE